MGAEKPTRAVQRTGTVTLHAAWNLRPEPEERQDLLHRDFGAQLIEASPGTGDQFSMEVARSKSFRSLYSL
jgi:hypothetical protein